MLKKQEETHAIQMVTHAARGAVRQKTTAGTLVAHLWQDQTILMASMVPIPAALGSPAGPNQWFWGAPVVLRTTEQRRRTSCRINTVNIKAVFKSKGVGKEMSQADESTRASAAVTWDKNWRFV